MVGAGSNVALSRPGLFNKEQTPLAILRYQPAVSRRIFRCFGAHLLRSPSNVKVKFVAHALAPSGATSSGHTTPVAGPGRFSPDSFSRQVTSFRCRVAF